ncbi:MAG TPA: hypothetical protein VGS41_08005 [Chthonomonadales bacterium]|nr:hypothetical protein [Chthonomonadales bacterium]
MFTGRDTGPWSRKFTRRHKKNAEEQRHDSPESWQPLNLYLDGEACAEDSATVEETLKYDAEASRELSELQHIRAAIKSIGMVEPPASLRQSIYAQTLLQPGRGPAGRQVLLAGFRATLRNVRFAIPAASFAVACLAALAIWMPGRTANYPAAALAPQTNHAALASSAPANLAVAMIAKPRAPEPAGRALSQTPAGADNGDSLLIDDNGQVIGPDDLTYAGGGSSQRRSSNVIRIQTATYRSQAPPSRSAPVTEAPLVSNRLRSGTRPSIEIASAGAYSFEPNMPDQYQHYKPMPNATAAPDIGPAVDTVAAPPAPVSPAEQPARPIKRYGRLLLPVSTPTTADFRREDMTKRLGFDRETLEGIRRHQVTISLIGGRF